MSQEPFVMFVCQHYTAFIFSSLKPDCLKPNTVIIYLHTAQEEAVGLVNIPHRFLQWLSMACSFHITHVLWAHCAQKDAVSTVTLSFCNGLIFILIYSWMIYGWGIQLSGPSGLFQSYHRSTLQVPDLCFHENHRSGRMNLGRDDAHVPSNRENKGLSKKQNNLKTRSCNETLIKDIWQIFYPLYAETYVRLKNNYFFSSSIFPNATSAGSLTKHCHLNFFLHEFTGMCRGLYLERPVYFERHPSQNLQNIFLCSRDFMKAAVIIIFIKIIR